MAKNKSFSWTMQVSGQGHQAFELPRWVNSTRSVIESVPGVPVGGSNYSDTELVSIAVSQPKRFGFRRVASVTVTYDVVEPKLVTFIGYR